MTQDKQRTRMGMLGSKHGKTVLTILAGLLTFGSPYLVYLMTRALNVEWFISIGSGVVSFAIGLALIWYIIRKKVIP